MIETWFSYLLGQAAHVAGRVVSTVCSAGSRPRPLESMFCVAVCSFCYDCSPTVRLLWLAVGDQVAPRLVGVSYVAVLANPALGMSASGGDGPRVLILCPQAALVHRP